MLALVLYLGGEKKHILNKYVLDLLQFCKQD